MLASFHKFLATKYSRFAGDTGYVEVILIISLGVAGFLLAIGRLPAIHSGVAVFMMVVTSWLLPGFLIWQLIGDRQAQPWFYWPPLSFAAGLGWLLSQAVIAHIGGATLETFAWLAAVSNSLLIGAYLIFRLTGLVPAAVVDWRLTKKGHHKWLFGAAVGMQAVLLTVFALTWGATSGEGDDWAILALIQRYLAGTTLHISEGENVWYFLLAFVIRSTHAQPFAIYHLYLPLIFLTIASLTYLVLADTLFDDYNLVYFTFVIQGLYILSDVQSRTGAGLGFLARSLEDKYAAWLLILPLVLAMFFKFIQSGRSRYLFLFSSLSVISIAVHAISITWLTLSIGAIGIFLLLYRRNRVILTFYAVFGLLVMGGGAGAWWLRSLKPDHFFSTAEPESMIPIGWSGLRVLILSAEQNSYMVHPHLLTRPLLLLALALTPLLLLKLRHSLTAQFLFSSWIIVLLLLFNPITAPLIGRVVGFWQIYRITWMVPVSLTIGYVFWTLLSSLKIRSKIFGLRRDLFRDLFLELVPLLFLLILTACLWGHISSGWRTLREFKSVAPTSINWNLMNYVAQIETVKVFFTPPHLRKQLPALATSKAAPVGARFTNLQDIHPFYEAKLINRSTINWIEEYEVDYIVIGRESPLEFQFEMLSGLFDQRYVDADYAVYAWQPERASDIEWDLVEANTYFLEGDLSTAEYNYYQAFEQSGHPLAGIGLATIYKSRLDFELAQRASQVAIQANPDNGWLELDLANAKLRATSPEDRDRLIQLANEYKQLLELKGQGEAFYNEVLADYRLFPRAVKLSAEGRAIHQTLLDYYRTKAAAKPDDFNAQQKLAAVYTQLEELEAAKNQYELLTRRFSGHFWAYIEQASFFANQDQPEKARQAYWQAVTYQSAPPRSGRPYLILAHYYYQQGEYEQGLAAAQQALKIAQALYRTDEIASARLELGLIYQAQENLAAASKQISLAAALSVQDARNQATLGDFFKGQNDLRRAIFHYRQAVMLAPDEAWPYMLLGRTLMAAGEESQGLTELNSALRLDPRAGHVYLRLAQWHRKQGDYPQALSHAQQAILFAEKDSTRAAGYREQGRIHQVERNTKMALEKFLRAVELDPNHAQAQATVGNFYRRRAEAEKAIPYYRQAVMMAPQQGYYWAALGAVLLTANDQDKARQAFKQALSLAKDDSRIYLTIGRAFGEQKDWSEVIQVYEQALTDGVANATIYIQLGDAYRQLNIPEKATIYYQQAARIAPNHPQLKSRLKVD